MDNSPPSSLERQIDSFLDHFKRTASKAMEAEWCSIGVTGINSSPASTTSATAADNVMSTSSAQQQQQQHQQHLVQGRHVTQDNSVASRPHPLMQKTKSRSSCLELNNMQETPNVAETDSQLFATLCEIDKNNYLFLFEKCKPLTFATIVNSKFLGYVVQICLQEVGGHALQLRQFLGVMLFLESKFKVNARQLRYFEKDHIRNLIPLTHLGILAEFEFLLNEWKIHKGYKNSNEVKEIKATKSNETNSDLKPESSRSICSRGVQTDECLQHSIGVNTMPIEEPELNVPPQVVNDGQQHELFQIISYEEEPMEQPMRIMSKNHVYRLENIIPSALARTKHNYRRKKLLTEGDRRLVAGSIVNYFESSNIKLVSHVMENLAEQITQHFPTESKKAWYDRHKSKGRGRLYMKFYNSHRAKNAVYPYNKKRKPLADSANSEIEAEASNTNLTRITYSNEADETTVSSIMDDMLVMDQDEGSKMVQSWLKSHKCEDFAEIMQMWLDTLQYRVIKLNQLVDFESVKEFLENWPSYKLERGHELLNVDFEHIYPQSMPIFRTRWLLYQQTIVKLFEAEVKDTNCCNILDQYKTHQDTLNEDTSCFILLHLLHAITKPYRVFKTATGSVRYCISDSQYSVTRFIHHHSDMDGYRERYPCIFVIGEKLLDIKECYVCFRNIRYKLGFVDCLIASVQLFVLFKLDDPLPSLHFWQFVRGYLFNIQREKERPYAIMENVIQYLETAGKRKDL